jgi:hypothetical protein
LQCKVACEEYGSPGAGVYRSNTDSGYQLEYAVPSLAVFCEAL